MEEDIYSLMGRRGEGGVSLVLSRSIINNLDLVVTVSIVSYSCEIDHMMYCEL